MAYPATPFTFLNETVACPFLELFTEVILLTFFAAALVYVIFAALDSALCVSSPFNPLEACASATT